MNERITIKTGRTLSPTQLEMAEVVGDETLAMFTCCQIRLVLELCEGFFCTNDDPGAIHGMAVHGCVEHEDDCPIQRQHALREAGQKGLN